MTDDQLDQTIENQFDFAQKSLEISERSLVIQEANVQATLALAKAIEHLANTQERPVITGIKKGVKVVWVTKEVWQQTR